MSVTTSRSVQDFLGFLATPPGSMVNATLDEDANDNPYARPSTIFAAVCAIVFTVVGIAGKIRINVLVMESAVASKVAPLCLLISHVNFMHACV